MALAKEIFYGSLRLFFRLEYILKSFSKKNPSLTVKIILIQAIYQHYYLTRVPSYAIVNETVNLAKNLGEKHSLGYINALLRRLPKIFEFPCDLSWNILFSFTQFFIDLLIQDYGKDQAKEILAILNEHPKDIVARERIGQTFLDYEQLVHERIFRVYSIKKDVSLEKLSNNSQIYIQNPTQVVLMEELIQKIDPCSIKKILDLCSAPGGKTILLSEVLKDAQFFANDINEDKASILKENFQKYDILGRVKFSHFPAQEFPLNETFDLVICDVPCSNSGVLHKRAEARFRILPQNLKELHELQLSIVKRAFDLLKPEGQIWYLTCSILKKENEELLEKVCSLVPLKITFVKTILPNKKGWDGGFAAILKK